MSFAVARTDRSQHAEIRISLFPQPDERAPGLDRYRTVAVFPADRQVEGIFVNPVAPWMVDSALSSIAAAGKTLQRSVLTASLDPVRDLGVRLFDALFSGSILRSFDRTLAEEHETRVRLVLQDEKAMAIPWEFLYDQRRNDFLVLSTRTPLVRSVSSSAGAARPEPEPDVRVLAAASDVTGSWDVEAELQALQDRLVPGFPPGQVHVLPSVTWPELQRAYAEIQPHVLHLMVTGSASASSGVAAHEQALAFSAETGTAAGERGAYRLVPPEEFARLVVSGTPPRLVVLNGCRTDLLAARLARTVPGVIGHRGLISDPAALAFTEGLYGALGRGMPLDTAVTAARLRVDERSPGGREWCAPVLYQDEVGVAFPDAARAWTGAHMPHLSVELAPQEGEPASGDVRALQTLRSLLAIHQANLDALLDRDPPAGGSLPTYTAREVETTRREVERLRGEIAAMEGVPT